MIFSRTSVYGVQLVSRYTENLTISTVFLREMKLVDDAAFFFTVINFASMLMLLLYRHVQNMKDTAMISYYISVEL